VRDRSQHTTFRHVVELARRQVVHEPDLIRRRLAPESANVCAVPLSTPNFQHVFRLELLIVLVVGELRHPLIFSNGRRNRSSAMDEWAF
jgi:hypothetical protein